jgi:hypothetical protein
MGTGGRRVDIFRFLLGSASLEEDGVFVYFTVVTPARHVPPAPVKHCASPSNHHDHDPPNEKEALPATNEKTVTPS